jgi:hypothetical protein
MKIIGTRLNAFGGTTGSLEAGACCAASRSTFDSASVVSSSTSPEIRNGTRGSSLRNITPR